jgi:predicted metal-binding membrane protein
MDTAKPPASIVEVLARGDRWIVGASLALLILLSWLYLGVMADTVKAMTGEGGSAAYMWLMPMGQWGVTEFVLGFAMWVVMMVGMMLPSAAPMLFAFQRVSRSRPEGASAIGPVGAFLLGYLLVWGMFSFLATVAQWILHATEVLTPAMVSSSNSFNAALLIAAGIYQFVPLKHTCLSKCRVPLGFLLTEWRDGLRGALIMGFRHGAFCVGCCWLLMALLFVGGVMNLLWIALLTVVVLVEKVLPFGRQAASVAGVLMIVGGSWILMRPALGPTAASGSDSLFTGFVVLATKK